MNPKTPISDDQLAALEADIQAQYHDRIREKGATPEGLFWDTDESMRTRFNAALELATFENASILDVGCGFGDFYGHLLDRGIETASYHGVDVSDVVLKEANTRWGGAPGGDLQNVSFEQRNILRDPFDDRKFDIAVVFGTLGHKLESIDNEVYIRQFMRTCFASADTVILNALSLYREGDWPYEEFVYYYDPARVFGYAQELTRNVRLVHDIEPIPQREFLILFEDDGRVHTRAGITELDT
jgi:SAM-dependent methyltransferase